MIDPQGAVRDVPYDQMKTAIANGGKVGVLVRPPDGSSPRYVPTDQVPAAVQHGGTVLPYEQQEVQHPGFWHSLYSDLAGMAKSAPDAAFNAVPGSSLVPDSVREKIGVGQQPNVLDQAQQMAQHYQAQKAAGYSLPYRLASPAAEAVGANVRGMEQSAQQGDVAGVAGHAATVPAVMAASAGATELAKLPIRAAIKQAPEMYQSALKPSTTLPQSKVASLVKTGLENEIPVTAGGAEKLQSLVTDFNQKIKATIDADPNRPINKFAVASKLSDTAQKFANQVTPEGDLQAVSETGNEFLRNQPGQIPAVDAQKLKSGTYQQLGQKAYGELKSASIEAQKALARGLKEEIAKQFPELSNLNAQESKLLDLEPVLERAVQRIGNHQLIGIGTPITTGAAKAVTGSNAMAASAGIIKAVLDNPGVKSRLAIALARAGRGGTSVAGADARVAAYSAALAQAASAANNEAPDDRTKQ